MNELAVIRNEEDAWALLEFFIHNKDADSALEIEFNGWPKFHVGIKGERYSGTLPGPLLTQLGKIQALSNTYYGRIVHGGDARNIKKHEKAELELLFEVREGSTEIKADLTSFLTKLSEALSNNKTSRNAAIVIIVLALSVSGSVVIPEISEDLTNQEKYRIELQERALEIAAEESDSAADFAKTYKEIISAASDATSIRIGGNELTEEQIQAISGSVRSGENVVLENEFHIEALRQYENHFTLTTRSEDGYTIRARVSKAFLKKHPFLLSEISTSLTSDTRVLLVISVKRYEDGYGTGIITGADT
ncbi:hypothetical protein KQ940_09795 [Marinobacterium sp. D7]|uniref:hypothetical protein n=1 Tax=Marinobacterium ramblicola TaxID=2849041 RepID=UPI001C2D3BE6|nr:hypothetical protein [Marinobacterium ramblicola]MBV1788348.1 hypothetical protein [Marinobacterium ramblicola]